MSRRSRFRFNFFLSSTVLVLLMLAGAFLLIQRYPWPTYLTDFSLARESTFVSYWPLPALEEDKQERKKLRRFPKSEQQRRLGVLMRRMDFLNVPLFDFFLDPGLQVLTPELPTGASPASPLIWPSLPTRRRLGSEDSSFRDVRYIVLPNSSGAQCIEGIYLVAGEELKVSLPLARNKRSVMFNVLPLAPSNLRAWLGQFSWARQFTDAEVNRLHTVSIPINDPSANALRLNLGNGNLVLTSGAITQWDRSGRLPIQIGGQSGIWKSANEKAGLREDLAVADGALDEAPEDTAALSSSISATTNQSIDSSATTNSQPPVPTAVPTPVPTPLPAVKAEPGSRVAKDSRASKTGPVIERDAKGKAKFSSSIEDLLDPASVKFNSVVPVPGIKTVALGYNVLFVQLDPAFNDVLNDEVLMTALAPNLQSYLSHALTIPVELPSVSSGGQLFQHGIVRQFADYIPLDLPILTKDLIAGRGVFNLYQQFRNFGFKVVSFAPPSALSLPDALSRGHEVPKVEGRWLDSNDWKFVARRKELDQQNEPATGLEAIFKSERAATFSAMSEGDYSKMAELLEGLERESDAIPDWRANELSLVSAKKQYLPRLLDSFQRWTKENSQVRFFSHVYLQNDDQSLRPSLKDFLKVLRFKKFKTLAFPGSTERLARIVLLDRVFGQLQDTLVARRMFHRTVFAALVPGYFSENRNGMNQGRFVLSVPGLLSRRKKLDHPHRFDDALSTLAQTVGVQLSKYDSDGRVLFRGEPLEREKPSESAGAIASNQAEAESQAAQASDDSSSQAEERSATTGGQAKQPTDATVPVAERLQPQQVSRFRMIVLPRAAGCQPFEWSASSPYFGLTSSQPIVEEPLPRGRVIRVFPCGLRDQVIELSWFQMHQGPLPSGASAASVSQWLGGSLRLASTESAHESQDAPLFLVGPQALSLDSLPMRLRRFSTNEVPQLFDMVYRTTVGRETLARVLNLNSQMQSPQMAARTLVYFFREPVRR